MYRHGFFPLPVTVLITLAIGSLVSIAAHSSTLPPPPEVTLSDDAGVDLMSGHAPVKLNDVNIGNGVSALPHTIATYRNYFWGFRDDYNIHVGIGNSGPNYWRTATVGHKSQSFLKVTGDIFSHATFKAQNNDGALLEQLGPDSFRYTMNDGTVVLPGTNLDEVTYPNGYQIKVHKKSGRIQSVTSNTGLQLKYVYRSNSLPSNPSGEERARFEFPEKIIALNNAVESCSPVADSCPLTQAWPQASYLWPSHSIMFSGNAGVTGMFKVTDAGGRTTSYLHSNYTMDNFGAPFEPRITQIKEATSKGNTVHVYDYAHVRICLLEESMSHQCPIKKTNVVRSLTNNKGSWSYEYPGAHVLYIEAGNSRGPMGLTQALMSTGMLFPRINNVKRADDVQATFFNNDLNKMATASVKGRHYAYEYDTRGNLTKITQTASGESRATQTGYPSTCDNLKTCNKPLWEKDANGAITDYSYYPEHGGIKTVTSPPNAQGIRATTWYKYQQYYAWYKNTSGSLVRADTPVWLPYEERSCTEGAANLSADTCATPANLVITRYHYGRSGVANNLWLRGIDQIADGTTRRTCYEYDHYGNQVSEFSPKSNLTECL
ncbi:hypothetical protein [Cellvibrio japonicus]|uniref:YD repeat protein n=1 Tax=Cellvibrio japonicus (strain Ueda107) TaxID=498211 RepID=B3PKS2_CELJU|nr:hypothetical protein [Cellvibrio japonicus]ACE85926.1 hypothetical protein CJA_0829 [Cellvibrio japonicus Ueda107]QEI11484.1 hypothetical protein FY117_04055 [Cellvibrio japonicus]QEI15058.1 hypothetical protein FY116_04055 [Cellvibrio japonicus]QEI18638.1 hypothetical protein FY115_04055 [Cellvibrio japonicus]